MKVIIGAGTTVIDGWISTQEKEINLLDENTWLGRFKYESIANILAEHVWEHLTYEEGLIAAKICYKFLQHDGMIRVAVPDGNFRNDKYQNLVKIGGPGPIDHPAYSHKVLYKYNEFVNCFEQAGFRVDLLEYCDDNGKFHYKYWNENEGKIGRSFRFDSRNSMEKLGMVSIIIDAKKEVVI
jgi:predicted SAM-dependent methyltransferase